MNNEEVSLAREWLLTESPFNPLQAQKILEDKAKLLKIFSDDREAQQWLYKKRQQAEGVPTELLGYTIKKNLSSQSLPLTGTVRFSGEKIWIEPHDQRGTVVPIVGCKDLKNGCEVHVDINGKPHHIETSNRPKYR